jgi:hypothetical protein
MEENARHGSSHWMTLARRYQSTECIRVLPIALRESPRSQTVRRCQGGWKSQGGWILYYVEHMEFILLQLDWTIGLVDLVRTHGTYVATDLKIRVNRGDIRGFGGI